MGTLEFLNGYVKPMYGHVRTRTVGTSMTVQPSSHSATSTVLANQHSHVHGRVCDPHRKMLQKRHTELEQARASFRLTEDLVFAVDNVYHWFGNESDYYGKLQMVDSAISCKGSAPMDVLLTVTVRHASLSERLPTFEVRLSVDSILCACLRYRYAHLIRDTRDALSHSPTTEGDNCPNNTCHTMLIQQIVP
jgi:hypothetical protein